MVIVNQHSLPFVLPYGPYLKPLSFQKFSCNHGLHYTMGCITQWVVIVFTMADGTAMKKATIEFEGHCFTSYDGVTVQKYRIPL